MGEKLTKKKLQTVLSERFPGSSFELKTLGSGRWMAFLVFQDFEGVNQHERQVKVWDTLENMFDRKELRKVSAVLTLTPEEADVEDDF